MDVTPPVKVIHLVQGLEVGGLEMMVVNLLENLDRSRFQPSVCCFDSLGPLTDRLSQQDIQVTLLRRRPGVDLAYVGKLARFLRQAKPRILHLHNPTAFFYGTLAGKLGGTPAIIYTEHGRDFSSSNKVKLAHRLLAKMVTQIVTVARFGKRYLTENEGIDPRKIITIHNGIDATRFRNDSDTSQLRGSLDLRENQPVIGIVARLDPIKNHALLINAMPRVVRAVPNTALLIIGDGPLRRELEAQVDELRLTDQVRFLGERPDVPELLSLLDVFVLCSHSEGLSLTLIEASAASLPIVATDVGGNSEVVEAGINGLLVPTNQPEPLAAAIIRLLTDKTTALRMGKAGSIKFEQEFTLDGMVWQYQQLYLACKRCSGSGDEFLS